MGDVKDENVRCVRSVPVFHRKYTMTWGGFRSNIKPLLTGTLGVSNCDRQGG